MAVRSPAKPSVTQTAARTPADPVDRKLLDAAFYKRLAAAVSDDVLPRLLRGHPATGRIALDGSVRADRILQRPVNAETDTPAVIAFTRLLLATDPDAAMSYMQARCARGMTATTFFRDLLTPAARRLGQMWMDDRCSFADVSIGSGRLQRLVRAVPGQSSRTTDASIDGKRGAILIGAADGEQHTLGIGVLEHVFREDGWDVAMQGSGNADALVEAVRATRYDIVGLSLSNDAGLDELTHLIARLRAASRNRNVAILVGGTSFSMQPGRIGDERAADVGADACAHDANDALDRACSLHDERAGRRQAAPNVRTATPAAPKVVRCDRALTLA